MTLKNKNILITGVGKGLGRNMVESFLESGAYVYGITRSANDIKNFKKHKNLKIFRVDVRNSNLIKKIFTHSKRIVKESYADGGGSAGDFSDLENKKGNYKFKMMVYQQKKDPNGNTIIKETTKDKRTTHWVPEIQN